MEEPEGTVDGFVAGAEPAWTPAPAAAADTRLARFTQAASSRSGLSLAGTPELHAWSLSDPDAFWRLVWDEFGVVGDAGARACVPSTLPQASFFPAARLNLAESILAPWAGSDDTAVICVGETADDTAIRTELSGRELCRRVGSFATWLRAAGIGPGDRIGLVLPVGPDALVTTLGALAVGAVVSSVSPEFGAPSILDRLGQLAPRVLVVASSYRWSGREFARSDNLAAVISALPSLTQVLTSDAEPDATLHQAAPAGCAVSALSSALAADVDPEFIRLPFDVPAYVLFSSGTTGKPKCLVHRAGGVLLKHLVELGLHADVGTGDRLLYYTTTSWMMWNWELSCLALGATLVLFDGSPTHPSPTALFGAARATATTHLGLSARLLDHLRSIEADLDVDGTPLREVLVTGSPLSVATARWLAAELGPDVMINPISGGTDLVGCFLAGDPTRPFHAGEMTGPALGMAVDVWTDAGRPAADGEPGELVCTQPFPTVPVGIWGDDSGSRLHEAYFDVWPGVWVHGDRAVRSAHGGIAILGRSDATLNVGGVRIGTAEIYAALAEHPAVEEALAFGQEWDGDTRIVLLVVPPSGVALDEAAIASIRSTIKAACSPRHIPAVVLAVTDLPRTQTGKLSEVAVRDAVAGREVKGIGALANPESLAPIVVAVGAAS